MFISYNKLFILIWLFIISESLSLFLYFKQDIFSNICIDLEINNESLFNRTFLGLILMQYLFAINSLLYILFTIHNIVASFFKLKQIFYRNQSKDIGSTLPYSIMHLKVMKPQGFT